MSRQVRRGPRRILIVDGYKVLNARAEGGTLAEKSAALYDFVLSVAGGEKTRNEINGFQGLAIFKTGATL